MTIIVTAARLTHILDGDSTGGGHRYGGGDPTKRKFPQSWDDTKIRVALLAVANDAASSRSIQPNGKIRLEGTRDGIRIRVIVDPTINAVVTAHPI